MPPEASRRSWSFLRGGNNRAAQAEALARKLRAQMDKRIAGPEYSKARRLAQKGFQSQEAVQTGAGLAARGVGARMLRAARWGL